MSCGHQLASTQRRAQADAQARVDAVSARAAKAAQEREAEHAAAVDALEARVAAVTEATQAAVEAAVADLDAARVRAAQTESDAESARSALEAANRRHEESLAGWERERGSLQAQLQEGKAELGRQREAAERSSKAQVAALQARIKEIHRDYNAVISGEHEAGDEDCNAEDGALFATARRVLQERLKQAHAQGVASVEPELLRAEEQAREATAEAEAATAALETAVEASMQAPSKPSEADLARVKEEAESEAQEAVVGQLLTLVDAHEASLATLRADHASAVRELESRVARLQAQLAANALYAAAAQDGAGGSSRNHKQARDGNNGLANCSLQELAEAHVNAVGGGGGSGGGGLAESPGSGGSPGSHGFRASASYHGIASPASMLHMAPAEQQS